MATSAGPAPVHHLQFGHSGTPQFAGVVNAYIEVYVEAALIGLTGVLIAQLVLVRFKMKERRNAQFIALAAFLEKTAECLEAMREKLASYEVPKGLGTRLREHIAEYESVIRSSTLSATK